MTLVDRQEGVKTNGGAKHMTKLLEITVPVFKVEKTAWDTFVVKKRQGNGRWKVVSNEYNHITSAKAALGNLFLELVAEAEEEL